jgi:hypothetical protein
MATLLEIDQASKHFGANWRRAASPDMICIAGERSRERRISTGVMPITRDNVAHFKHT